MPRRPRPRGHRRRRQPGQGRHGRRGPDARWSRSASASSPPRSSPRAPARHHRRRRGRRRHRRSPWSASAPRRPPNGGLSTEYLERVAEEIGAALARARRRAHRRLPQHDAARHLRGAARADPGARVGQARRRGLRRGVNPEFLREGTSVRDFLDPPKTVIGEIDDASGDVVAALYEGLPGPGLPGADPRGRDDQVRRQRLPRPQGRLRQRDRRASAARSALDSHEVMDIFRADTKLNICPAYLRPGFAFGGSCLPKDLRALAPRGPPRRRRRCRSSRTSSPPTSGMSSARSALVEAPGKRRVGLFGLSFKSGHRRPAREPAGRARRAPARAGLRRCGSTTPTSPCRGCWAPTAPTSRRTCRTWSGCWQLDAEVVVAHGEAHRGRRRAAGRASRRSGGADGRGDRRPGAASRGAERRRGDADYVGVGW